MAKTPAQIYQIKVTLKGSRPPVWRRIQVQGNTTLRKLHDILQTTMGWEDAHLHMFTIEGFRFGDPEVDEFGELESLDEGKSKLSQVIYREGQRFTYEYDFGDSWIHTLLVEKILLPEKGTRYPICLAGKRACPPEDVGGVGGYDYFLEAINDPEHENHEEYLEWYGEEFDPDAFDLETINSGLRSIARSRRTPELDLPPEDQDEALPDFVSSATSWVLSLPPDLQAVAENLPLRRDIVALLIYLDENKVTGTASTGNFPLKAVREICAQFVDPTILAETTADGAYPLRSEFDVWPLYFRHVLAAAAEMVAGGPGRRWKLTPTGESFLPAPPAFQVLILIITWWIQVNWLIAIPFGAEDEYLPDQFRYQTLTKLLDLPVEAPVPFNSFAKQLIKAGGLEWEDDEQDESTFFLRAIVERSVILPLADFGVLVTTHQPHKILKADFKELATIQVTSFGRSLLETIKNMLG